MTENKCKKEHLWKINLGPHWKSEVQFLREFIKVPVTCRNCNQKGLEIWLYSHTAESEKE